jgi:hypothetical protein
MRWIFWDFCRNWFLIDPVHYLSSRSNFGFKFAEIFVIEKQLSDLASRRLYDVASWRLSDSASRGVDVSPRRRVGFRIFKTKLGESESQRLLDSESQQLLDSESQRLLVSESRGVTNSPTPRVRQSSATGELLWSHYSNFFKFIIELQHFKQLNQPYKGPL